MDITIFSTTNCGVCHALMQWLDNQGVKYQNKVVDESEAAMNDFMAINDGMIGAPLTIIVQGETITKIPGFDQPKLKLALQL